MTLALTLSLALAAGMALPVGALTSSLVPLRSICLRHDIDSFVSYFGGGALLAAIALVLLIEEKPEEISGHLLAFLDKQDDSVQSAIGEVWS